MGERLGLDPAGCGKEPGNAGGGGSTQPKRVALAVAAREEGEGVLGGEGFGKRDALNLVGGGEGQNETGHGGWLVSEALAGEAGGEGGGVARAGVCACFTQEGVEEGAGDRGGG